MHHLEGANFLILLHGPMDHTRELAQILRESGVVLVLAQQHARSLEDAAPQQEGVLGFLRHVCFVSTDLERVQGYTCISTTGREGVARTMVTADREIVALTLASVWKCRAAGLLSTA